MNDEKRAVFVGREVFVNIDLTNRHLTYSDNLNASEREAIRVVVTRRFGLLHGTHLEVMLNDRFGANHSSDVPLEDTPVLRAMLSELWPILAVAYARLPPPRP
jgi:hypothetical protein